jgi:hypothetical protein
MMYTRYRHLVIDEAHSPPTDTQVAAIETTLGATLPESFRNFLSVANGGYLEYCIDVPTGAGKSEPLSFSRIFATSGAETFINEILRSRERMKTPPGVLPFAREDDGSSIVFLDLSPEGSGRVVAFVQGLPDWTGLRTETAFVELASSFDDYIAKLYMDRDDLIDRLERWDVDDTSDIDAIEESLDVVMPQWREDAELLIMLQERRRSLTADN